MTEEKERIRKAHTRKDGRTQRMMSFRVDNDLAEALKSIANKGKLINDLLHEYFASRNRNESQSERDPAGDTAEDTRP